MEINTYFSKLNNDIFELTVILGELRISNIIKVAECIKNGLLTEGDILF